MVMTGDATRRGRRLRAVEDTAMVQVSRPPCHSRRRGAHGAYGAVAEWSKALAWKVSIRQNRIEGSNPSRSATTLSSPIQPNSIFPRIQRKNVIVLSNAV